MESSWRRAWEDTERFRHTAGSFWGLEIVGASVLGLVGGYAGFLLAPINATPKQSFMYPAIGAVVGVIVGLTIVFLLIYGLNLFSAPYRQRNEARDLLLAKPKPIPLLNRGELIRAISEVQHTSGELLMAQEQLDNLEARSPNLVHVDAMETRDDAYAKYKQAINKLSAEKMVAGKPFESLLSDLIAYISTQVWVKEAKPTSIGGDDPQKDRTALGTFGRIAGKINEATRKIDELSGQAPDKEGYQT